MTKSRYLIHNAHELRLLFPCEYPCVYPWAGYPCEGYPCGMAHVYCLSILNVTLSNEAVNKINMQREAGTVLFLFLILIRIVSRYLSTKLSFGRKVSRYGTIIMSRVNAAQLVTYRDHICIRIRTESATETARFPTPQTGTLNIAAQASHTNYFPIQFTWHWRIYALPGPNSLFSCKFWRPLWPNAI